LGNMLDLQQLDLSLNQLSGPLPKSLTNLRALGYFHFDTRRLCKPGNAAFEAWFAGIADKSPGATTCMTPRSYLPILMR